jgi:hypothetical protein
MIWEELLHIYQRKRAEAVNAVMILAQAQHESKRKVR